MVKKGKNLSYNNLYKKKKKAELEEVSVNDKNLEEEVLIEENLDDGEVDTDENIKEVNNIREESSLKDKQNTPNPKSSKKVILKNYFYNAIYQVFLIIVPLITTPYVSRVLLPQGIGQYSFSLSLITYFTIFAALGSNLYGQREISKYQNDKHKQSIVVWEVIIVRIFSTFICLALNFIFYGFNAYGSYSLLMLIMSLNIFSTIFDFSFVLMGNEDFGKLAIRNFIIKSLTVASIFVFVKTQNDVWIYTLIHSVMIVLSNLIFIPYVIKHISRVKRSELHPKKIVVPILKLFLPTIIISIYTILDKTLVGLILRDDAQNGFYEQTDKIIKIVLTLVTSLSAVMFSRNSEEKQKGNTKALKENVYFATKIVYFIGLPLMFGTIAISKNINLWFFGEGYGEVITLMMVCAPIIMAIGLNNVTGVQYLIAIGRENTFTKTVIIGAVINLMLSIALIFLIGVAGAIISSVISELIILIVQLIILREEISIKKFLLSGWKNLLASVIMFGVLMVVQSCMNSSILNTILLILLGAFIYLVVVVALKDDFIKDFKRKVFKKGE